VPEGRASRKERADSVRNKIECRKKKKKAASTRQQNTEIRKLE
jgi:hypothetical protein